jgi:exodeoxyribonuclease III
MGGGRLGWKAILAQRGIFHFSPVRIITCNVNGLRAADRKGFIAWMLRQHPAQKRGYSGVAIYAKKEPGNVTLRKYAFMDRFMPRLEQMRRCGREFVICGDWNIAHREIDVKNWKTNQDTTGFLPREREWLTRVFEEHGFVDVFRALDPSPDRFTWWVQWANAREGNIGWRIDYQVATPGIAKKATKAAIYTQENFSDHAPVVVDYDSVL